MKNDTGFSLNVNMTRALLYLVLLGLSITGEVPYWALPCLLLYDINWYAVYNSPKRLKLMKSYDAQRQLEEQLRFYNALKMPGTEVEG